MFGLDNCSRSDRVEIGLFPDGPHPVGLDVVIPSLDMRYLGIDLGDKRTGLAIGDSELRLASPVAVLEVPVERDEGAALLAALVEAAAEHLGTPERGAGELVVGLPLNMDGSEGPRAVMARRFGAKLEAAARRRVVYFDERLTSASADWQLARTGLTRGQKKSRRDALAAAAMLQGYLDSLVPDPRDAT